VSGELLTIASLNTRGIPPTRSQLAERYAVIGAGFDAGPADVVCCQEVLTYWHLRLLVRRTARPAVPDTYRVIASRTAGTTSVAQRARATVLSHPI